MYFLKCVHTYTCIHVYDALSDLSAGRKMWSCFAVCIIVSRKFKGARSQKSPCCHAGPPQQHAPKKMTRAKYYPNTFFKNLKILPFGTLREMLFCMCVWVSALETPWHCQSADIMPWSRKWGLFMCACHAFVAFWFAFVATPRIVRETFLQIVSLVCLPRTSPNFGDFRSSTLALRATAVLIPPWRRESRRAWKSKKLNSVVFFEPETSFTEHGWHLRGSRLFFRDSGRDGGLMKC